MWSALLFFVLYHVKSGELYGGIGTFLEDAGLILPMGTMEAAGSAFWADTITAAIVVVIRRFFHQCLKRQWASFWVHFAYLHFVIEIEKAPSLFCYAQCNNGACRVLSFCRNYRKLTVYCLDKISETPFERDIISSNCECCVTSFINLVKEAAYPIFLILSRKSKRTVDVAKIFFVCRMSMAI